MSKQISEILNSGTKEQLFQQAKDQGLQVYRSWTKTKIAEAMVNSGDNKPKATVAPKSRQFGGEW